MGLSVTDPFGCRGLTSPAVLRFHIPLIEPDVRVSRIRLSDKASCVRAPVAAPKQRESHQAEDLGQVAVRIASIPTTRDLMLRAQPPAEPLGRVAEVIEEQFGVHYHIGHVWRVLRGMGWSCQKPERRARERNEEAIEDWRKNQWPRIRKTRSSGRSIVFIDETGVMLQPVVRRTWGPQGQTPVLYMRILASSRCVISRSSFRMRRCSRIDARTSSVRSLGT